MAIFTSQSLKSATSGGLAALRFFQSNSVSQAFFKAVCSQLLRKPQRGKFFPCMKTHKLLSRVFYLSGFLLIRKIKLWKRASSLEEFDVLFSKVIFLKC